MRCLRLVKYFMLSSAQTDLAYRANFAIGLFNSIRNLIIGVPGRVVLFSRGKTLNGWTLASTLALLGAYLTISALRGWFIGPSLETLVVMLFVAASVLFHLGVKRYNSASS